MLVVNYPPDAITDLELVESDFDSRTITLMWTATGDQADVGTGTFNDHKLPVVVLTLYIIIHVIMTFLIIPTYELLKL